MHYQEPVFQVISFEDRQFGKVIARKMPLEEAAEFAKFYNATQRGTPHWCAVVEHNLQFPFSKRRRKKRR